MTLAIYRYRVKISLQISDVREAGENVIYIAAPRHSLMYTRIQWVEICVILW